MHSLTPLTTNLQHFREPSADQDDQSDQPLNPPTGGPDITDQGDQQEVEVTETVDSLKRSKSEGDTPDRSRKSEQPVATGNGYGLAIFLAMTIIGAINLTSCPANRGIPIVMLLTGSIGVASCLVGYFSHKYPRAAAQVEGELSIVLTILTIILAFFVFGTTVDTDNIILRNYCDKSLYLFAYWWLLVKLFVLAIALVVILFTCVCLSCVACCKRK